MTSTKRARLPLVFGAAVLVVSGCASSGITTRSVATSPDPVTPLPSSQVASTDLPAIGETADRGPLGPVNPALTGDPVLGGSQPQVILPADMTGGTDTMQTASTGNGSFVTLDSVGTVPTAPGRDLTGGLTIEKLLGGWTVVSGGQQCKLNLTYTQKTGTSRYRASTPACQLPGLSVVSSWQLAGNQVQLFDENNDMIAALILSGNRFIGTLAGGQGISMVG